MRVVNNKRDMRNESRYGALLIKHHHTIDRRARVSEKYHILR